MSSHPFVRKVAKPTGRVRVGMALLSLIMVAAACSSGETAVDTAAAAATSPPATAVPATAEPATAVPATEVPPTEVPPTEVPPTEVPPTEVPPTEVPPTEVPPTEVPPTEVPATPAPETEEPEPAAPVSDTSAAGGGCSADADVATETASVESGGNTYEVTMTIPADYLATEPNPVIINFHGIGSNGFEQSAFSLLPATTTTHITLHPTGQMAAGDDRNSWELPQFDADDRDDVAFTIDLIDWVSERACVDQNRIYAMGMSNGAFMTSTLVCDLGDRIAAAASVAGVTHVDECDPATATPYIAFHGRDDTTVPFNGGGFSTLAGVSSDEPSPFFEQIMPEEFSQFATTFDCGDAVEENVSDTVIRFSYPDCQDGAELAFYEVGGGGHTWPGSVISLAVPSLGPTNMSVNATELILEFFDRHTLN